MKGIYLPGFSVKNKDEANLFVSGLGAKYICFPVGWSHWDTGEVVGWDIEIDSIIRNKSKLFSEVEFLVCKSIGCFFATILLGKLKKLSKLRKILFLGFPYNDLDDKERSMFVDVVRNLKRVNLLFVLNNKDDHCNVDDLVDLLTGIDYRLIIKESVGHSYIYSNIANEFLEE